MKQIFLALSLAISLSMPAYAADAEKKQETKKVCVDIQGKDGKPIMDPKTQKPKQDCKEVKVHQKHEGTKVPDKK